MKHLMRMELIAHVSSFMIIVSHLRNLVCFAYWVSYLSIYVCLRGNSPSALSSCPSMIQYVVAIVMLFVRQKSTQDPARTQINSNFSTLACSLVDIGQGELDGRLLTSPGATRCK